MRIGRTVASLSRTEAVALVMTILMICVVWVRYDGIFQDSILYTLQALNAVDPARYGKDVFLAYGSQDQFTLFSPIYGTVIRLIGIAGANVALYLLGVTLWLTGAALLAKALNIPVWLAIISVVMLPMPYGIELTSQNGESLAPFHAKESFLTPRLYAEALSLIGISLMLKGKRYWALAPTLLGFVLHPVMGLAALLTGYVHETIKSTRRWRWFAFAALMVMLISAAGAIGISPANRLFVALQGAWLEAVTMRVNPSAWGWGNGYWRLLFNASLTATLLFDQRPLVRQLGLATLLASAIGFLADYVGWHVLHSELILQAQPWRAVWVLTVIARFALALLLITGQEPQNLKRSAFWIFLAAISLPSWLQAIGGILGFAVASMEVILGRSGSASKYRHVIQMMSIPLSAALFLLSTVFALHYISGSNILSPSQPSENSIASFFAIMPPFLQRASNVVVATGLAVLHVSKRQIRLLLVAPTIPITLLVSISGILLFLNGQAMTDARRSDKVRPFAGILTRSGDIYWESYPEQIWFGLGRTSYLSTPQQNVVSFSQRAAFEVLRRAQHLRVIGSPESSLRFRVRWINYNHPWAPNALPQLCADSTIAYVIAERQPYRAMASFTDIGNTPEQFFIYDCAALTPE